jgi:light-regulated signal transduction histidine kinase (bacteriophytochrome)/CheY-like chemotaxis protein
MSDRLPLDISACDREPIHIPGHIQPTGILLALEPDTWLITHVSANITAFVSEPRSALGQPVRNVIGSEASHALANALAGSPGPGLPGRVFDLTIAGASYNAAIHKHAGRVIIELEPSSGIYEPSAPLILVRSMLARMQQATSVDDMCTIAVRQIEALIEFDRVMVYRFNQDGSGYVVAEACSDGTPSFLDHRYPASDIPQQARALYLKNWLRSICDVDSEPIGLLSLPTETSPLDMTYCGLRYVSPVHIEYLKNMDVAASLSISIVVDSTLWGLIACHNRTPRIVPADLRVAAEFFGQAFSLQLQTLARADVAEMLRDTRERIDRIVTELPPGIALPDSLGPRLSDIENFLPCDGAALWFDSRLVRSGSCPPDDEIPRIADALVAAGHTSIFATQELSAFHRPALAYAAQASGLMAIPLSRSAGHYLMLFRREIVRTINWAGNPDKVVEQAGEAQRLSPRKSFELWREVVKNQSQIWEPHDRLTAEALRISLLDIVLKYNELVAHERAKADSLHRLHTAEFNHRAKNALALIAALVAQSKERHSDVQAFVADLEGRIRSLALAHDLANKPGMLELGRLFEMELEAFDDGEHQRVVIDGPPVDLAEAAAGVMTLVVHELATNASKHGALSVPGGSVVVRWRIEQNGSCAIDWRERGGPTVSQPSKTRFGSFLIEHQIPFELGGRADINYAPSGLEVSLWLPAASIGRRARPQTRGRAKPSAPLAAPGLLTGQSVMLVEDSLLVALEIERSLRRLGAADVFVFGTLAQALQFAEALPIQLAILDVNLKGTMSYPVADILVRRGAPFVFATGYGPDLSPPPRFSEVPVVGKSFTDAELVIAIQTAIALTRPAGTTG